MAEATVPEGELFEVLSIPLRREAMEALREHLETLRALRVHPLLRRRPVTAPDSLPGSP